MGYESQYFNLREPVEIPIIRDMFGYTAVDYAMGLQEEKDLTDVRVTIPKGVSAEQLKSLKVDTHKLNVNMEMAMVLMECIKDYPSHHSSPYLVNAIIAAVE